METLRVSKKELALLLLSLEALSPRGFCPQKIDRYNSLYGKVKHLYLKKTEAEETREMLRGVA